MSSEINKQDRCKTGADASRFRERLPGVAESIIASCSESQCYTHVDYEPIPFRHAVVETILRIRELLFPGYFSL